MMCSSYLRVKNLNVDEVRADIEAMGDSTLVVGDSNLIKVHVHVHNPGVPVGYGADRGVLLDVVVENMQEQYQGFVANAGHLDTRPKARTKLPEIEPGRIAVVTVAPGEGLTEIFYSMGAGRVISGGQTMNPSSEDFLNAIMELKTDKIVLLPNNKNILMTASTAASLANGKDVRVVPTTTIPQGLSALLSLDPQGNFHLLLMRCKLPVMLLKRAKSRLRHAMSLSTELRLSKVRSLACTTMFSVLQAMMLTPLLSSFLRKWELNR